MKRDLIDMKAYFLSVCYTNRQTMDFLRHIPETGLTDFDA